MQLHSSHNRNIIDTRINLLTREDNHAPHGLPAQAGRKIFRVSRFILYLLVIFIIAFLVFSYQVIFTNNSVSDIFSGKVNIFSQLSILAGNNSRLRGEADDRINVLLLGMGGAGHEGPYLTDTIILASIKPSIKKVSMISIPRDLYADVPGYGWWKINNANSFGEENNQGKGGELVREVVAKTFNIEIPYYIRVDFAGFEKIIDDLDGVKVNVERAFTDYQYPTEDFKYQVVTFAAGQQTMDGDTALKFARSRHGNAGEGSDFARSQRQQKILQAVKARVLSYSFFLSPRKIKNISEDLSTHLRTNFAPWELVRLIDVLENVDTDNIISKVLDDSPSGFLYPNIINGAYVLQPKGDDFSQIQYMTKNIFKKEEALTENKIISAEINNGTEIAGLASRIATELKFLGYQVNKLGNAPVQNYPATEVYKLSSRSLPEEVAYLENKFKTKIQNSVPQWIKDTAAPDLDFFIILGKDADVK